MRAVVSSRGSSGGGPGAALRGVALGACAMAAACSASSREVECVPAESEVCESACGVGLRACGEDGRWEPCWPPGDAGCLPGESGPCATAPGGLPGRWSCGEDCTAGPCEPRCEPGDRAACEAECGPGRMRCGDDGLWGPCVEEVSPDCRPGEAEACDEGRVARCTAACVLGPCEEPGPCVPGERASCRSCGVQLCLPEGLWGPCLADCFPDEVRPCPPDEPGSGPGAVQPCTVRCAWGECVEVDS